MDDRDGRVSSTIVLEIGQTQNYLRTELIDLFKRENTQTKISSLPIPFTGVGIEIYDYLTSLATLKLMAKRSGSLTSILLDPKRPSPIGRFRKNLTDLTLTLSR